MKCAEKSKYGARDDWPARAPLVLGHEGTGIVREVGTAVTRVRTGDHGRAGCFVILLPATSEA